MKYLILILLLLIPSIASACESYEECMEFQKTITDPINGDYIWDWKTGLPAGYVDEGKEGIYLKAIAFKLDEISKKLDRAESNTPVDIIASQIRKGDK